MELIDLSRELFHRTQPHPKHPPLIVTVSGDYSENTVAHHTVFTPNAFAISQSHHPTTRGHPPLPF